jgi:hypothetical protein
MYEAHNKQNLKKQKRKRNEPDDNRDSNLRLHCKPNVKVRGWLKAGEARFKPVPLDRNVREHSDHEK